MDQIVTKNPGISARRALKRSIGLRVTVRTVRNYLNRLGWHVIERNTVSLYRLERFIYARLCLITHEPFIYHIFMDECTVELVRHGPFFRLKEAPNQIMVDMLIRHRYT